MADERDPKISRRYRELGSEEPSRELDQAILAAAHRAVGRSHAPLVTPAGRHRWYFSLAAAAVLVLAVAVTVHIERQQPEGEMMSAPPVPQAAPAPPPAPAPQRAQRQIEQKQAESSSPRREAAAESRAPQAAAPVEDRPAGTPRAGEAPSASSGAIVAARPSATVMSRADRAASTPERELERIAELRRLGRDEEADKALAEFKKRYPDYRFTAEVLQKVERKAAPASR